MSATDVTKEPVVDWGIRLFFAGATFAPSLGASDYLFVVELPAGLGFKSTFLIAPLFAILSLYNANQIIQKLKKVPLP
jgi:hypothetical protein